MTPDNDALALVPDDPPADNAGMYQDWLKKALRKPGKSQKGLAKALGVDPSVVSKMVSGKREIKLAEIASVTAYLGESPPDLNVQPTRISVSKILLAGRIAAGVWREAETLSPSDMYPVAVARDERYPTVEQYALLVEGSSVNRIVPNGAYVICAPYFDVRRDVQDGDLAHVERRRGGLVEATVKCIKITRRGEVELWPESTDAKQTPIKLADTADVEEVVICGLVIGYSVKL